MDEEIECIEKNQTGELVDVPKDKDVISVKWIYKTKKDDHGNVQKHKARMVARGFTQQPGIDFNETFAPVARMDTVRTKNHCCTKQMACSLDGCQVGILKWLSRRGSICGTATRV